MRRIKYWKSRKAALAHKDELNKLGHSYRVFKMPKGSRHHGEYAVCDDIEYLNTN